MIVSDGLVIGQLGLRNSVSVVTTIVEWASLEVLVVKNLPASAGDIRDAGSIPGSGRSPRGGHGNPLQSSCLQNPMDRGAWWDAVQGVAKSWTRLKWLSMRARTILELLIKLQPKGPLKQGDPVSLHGEEGKGRETWRGTCIPTCSHKKLVWSWKLCPGNGTDEAPGITWEAWGVRASGGWVFSPQTENH